MAVVLKRAYDQPGLADGIRILVERLWPRGLSKEAARIDWWVKELAPSTALRQWFHARPSMWREFRKRYLEELRASEAQAPLQKLYDLAASDKLLTLVFASRDVEHNSAVVLKELLEGMRKPPSSSGPQKNALPMRARVRR
jgi:uncharacterized protein YeaO (DUF488 family)